MIYQTRFNKTLITANDLDSFFQIVNEYIDRKNEKPNYSAENKLYLSQNTKPSEYKRQHRRISMVEEIAMGLQN